MSELVCEHRARGRGRESVVIRHKPRCNRLTWLTHFNDLQQREEVFLQPILEKPQHEVIVGDCRMK